MTKPKAHPDDILILANVGERADYPAFSDRQVFSVTMPGRLEGRRFSTAWITEYAVHQQKWNDVYDLLLRAQMMHNSTVESFENWQPEPNTLLDDIKALPDDVGYTGAKLAGYKLAVEDVLALCATFLAKAEA